MTRFTILATAAVLSASAAGAQAPAQPAQRQPPAAQSQPRLPSVTLPPDLERVLRDYERFWRAGDAASLAGIFTEDGFIARPGGWIRGRDAIRQAYQAMAGGDLRLRAIAYAVGDTVGYIVGAYGYGETAANADNGKFVLALRREPGRPWMIASDLDSANRRPAP
ncbi:MAG: nuclear transport factor 2 family protein [Gemmatimonadaceae bacterium]